MMVTIHQPDFLPWLGFFDRWQTSDLYIILDDVQFLRRGWHHRDRIKTRQGPRWLTVPVIKKGNYYQLIKDVRIDESTNWRTKHLKTIEATYRNAPNFKNIFEQLQSIYDKNHECLMDFNVALLNCMARALDIRTPCVFASDYHVTSDATQRLVDLVTSVAGTEYLTGSGSRGYLEEPLFTRAGIRVVWQEYQHPVYRQLYGDFVPMLSALDFLMMRQSQENDHTA